MKQISMCLIGLIALCCWQGTVAAQTLPLGEQDLDGLLRSYQLTGKVDERLSFTVRPMVFSPVPGPASKRNHNRLLRDSFYTWLDASRSLQPRSFHTRDYRGELVVLPVSWQFKFNSHHPYGWNDEGMIPAKGLQQQLSAGLFARYGPLSVQLQPQLVIAGNPAFATTTSYGAPTNGNYTRLFAGQSAVRLTIGPISAGVSTENLWWGPGQFSSLLLSNNAPGFAHITLNTTRPIETPIGGFEFQLIGGRLDEDSADGGLYENFNLRPAPLKQDWRYLNAMVFTYRPSFVPGLFVGMTRAFQLYSKNVNQPGLSFINKYVPVLSAIFKDNSGGSIEDARGRDQQISVFARMLFPQAHSEFYFEYGWNDHSANTRDFMGDPEHSAAYIVGGKKMVPLRKQNQWIEISGELTHMAQSVDYVVRNAGNWYEHGTVQQGMTNQRQILGAGSGFGNNVQTLAVNWLKGVQKLGFTLQRIQHDPGALVGNFGNLGLREFVWNEWALGVQGRWAKNNWLFNLDMQFTNSQNYGWEKGKKAGNLFLTGGVRVRI